MGCSACSFPTYFTLKLSATRVNWMCLYLCVQSHGTILLWVYLCFASRFSSNSFIMSPDWGRPYMTFWVSTYMLPSVVAYLV